MPGPKRSQPPALPAVCPSPVARCWWKQLQPWRLLHLFTRQRLLMSPTPVPWAQIIGLNVLAALLPASGRFVPDKEELEERPPGPLQVRTRGL